MFDVIKQWWQRYLSDPQAVLLMAFLGGITLLLLLMGEILAPIIASIVIAYLLQWVVNVLKGWRVPPLLAVIITYCAFLGLFLTTFLVLWPIVWQQLIRL